MLSLDFPTSRSVTPLFPGADRSTVIGKQIDAYLQQQVEIPDPAVHLLFAANRWELV